MSFPRYDYMQSGVPTVEIKMRFNNTEAFLPKFERPVSAVENFKRAARREKPYWVPNSLTDMQSFSPTDHISEVVKIAGSKVATRFCDWFGADWTYVVEVGGAMLTPGTKFMDDVTLWEEKVKFPDLNKWDFHTSAEDYMSNRYDPEKPLCMDIGIGCTERLVSLMGGYEDSMLALAVEPEACADFFEAFVDFEIKHFDKLLEYYPPLAMITYHDDWGSEKDTFFSPSMLENMILEPTRRLFNYIKSKGIAIEFHNCGNINRFMPYIADLGPEFIQVQRRVIDFPAVKKQYGDKFGFCGAIEGLDTSVGEPSKEKLVEMVRNTVDALGKGGGLYIGMLPISNPELLWYAINELYAYSSELYANE